MSKFDMSSIKGVIPALITCFDENENFDEGRMRSVVRYLLTQNIDGFYLTGSTGETFLMTPEERKKVVEVIIDEVKGQVPIIVHVGAISTKISIELAQHAYEAGADAISSVPPFYWRFNEDNIYNYYKDITESTPLPMIVYNVALTGGVSFDLIKRVATIDGVEGVKYTASTHYEIMKIKEEIGEDFKVYSGSDEMAMSGLTFGADGIIGSFYNVIPEVFVRLNNAVAEGNIQEAKKAQEVANRIIMFSLKYDYVSLMKNYLTWMGIDAGYSRRPFNNYRGQLEEDIKVEFKKLIEHEGMNDVAILSNICK